MTKEPKSPEFHINIEWHFARFLIFLILFFIFWVSRIEKGKNFIFYSNHSRSFCFIIRQKNSVFLEEESCEKNKERKNQKPI